MLREMLERETSADGETTSDVATTVTTQNLAQCENIENSPVCDGNK